MKQFLAVALIILCATAAHAATAIFTGQMQFGTSVTGQQVVKCQYNAMGNVFWATLRGASCPATIEVE